MYVLRQLGSVIVSGAQTALAYTQDMVNQINDPNPRYIMKLAGNGKVTSDSTILSSLASFSVPLPQNYDSTKRLHVTLVSDKTVKVSLVSSVTGSSDFMLRAGLASDQQGISNFCGVISSITVLNPQGSSANLEWMIFEMPDINSTLGWRDGSISTGILGPTPSTSSSSGGSSVGTVSYVTSVRYDYSSVPVTNSAWVQLLPTTPGVINFLTIFHGFGAPIYLGAGAAGFEAPILLIPPGGINGQIALTIPSGTRLSLKAVTSTTVDSGELDITAFQ